MNPLVCTHCGERAEHLAVDADGLIRCPHCDRRRAFRRLPLFCVTGPSGAGKSAVAQLLADAVTDRFVVLEQDVLWQAGLRDDDDPEHRLFRTAWLRMAAMIHQSGRPVVLCGTVVPPEFEPLPERALFSGVSYLCLMCDDDVLAERLRRRPAWRQWDEPRIAETLDYAAWIRAAAAVMSPPMTLLDTTGMPVEEVAEQVHEWLAAAASR